MSQYTIKLHTYDPVVIAVYERLRHNRKQAAFTLEAVKYFLSIGQGHQVADLMAGVAPVISERNESDAVVSPNLQRQYAGSAPSESRPDSSTILASILR